MYVGADVAECLMDSEDSEDTNIAYVAFTRAKRRLQFPEVFDAVGIEWPDISAKGEPAVAGAATR